MFIFTFLHNNSRRLKLITLNTPTLKTSFKIIISFLIIAFVFASCSRKKDSFVSRNYHAMSTKYNTLYNGYLALEAGKQSVIDSYDDNYWEILPIERMQISEDIILPGQSKNQDFERAEEKAIKAIQKHGMNIKGKEKNPQIDEAYLLLGKARYYDQRFVPAIQAFNYILYKYPASDRINQAKIWREKTNIRLENNELAIKNLKRLLEQEPLKDQDLADATSMLAQAYINTKALDSAVTQLKIATVETKDDEERGRYLFIQAQLYNRLKYPDSANIAFDEIIDLNRRTPRAYRIAAYVGKARNFDFNNDDKIALLELLYELENDRENRPFLGKIYHQIAEYHVINQNDSLAVEYYNKSLRTNPTDRILVADDYENLGDIFFDYTEYKIAGSYYDSTMQNMKENSKPYRIIKRKRENLTDVIYYEDIAYANDSILNLVAMTDSERQTYFDDYTQKLRDEYEELQQKEEELKRKEDQLTAMNSDNSFGVSNSIVKSAKGPTPGQASTFYFYNTTTAAYGKNEFIKIWGDRKLEDNWRWSNKGSSSISAEEIILNETTEDNELFNPEYYLAKIPSDQQQIDSIATERNYAYYQLGVIYKEKFKEYDLSKDKFNTLLTLNPDEKLILPTKYNLYKIYDLENNNDQALLFKNDIINNYSDSRYAAILRNPETGLSKDENSPESIYEQLYAKLENQQFQEVIANCDTYINMFEGESMLPKFELLKATATGRLYGLDAYSNALNFVAYNYANTTEGQQAQYLLDETIPRLSSKAFVDNPEERNYMAVYYFNNPTDETLLAFRERLEEQIKTVNVYDLSISVDVYNPTTTFVLIHGFNSELGALGYVQALEERKKDKIINPHFAISSTNYQTIQVHKNMDEYLNIE